MEKLFLTLRERRRPEDVAQMIVEEIGGYLSKAERARIHSAAAGSLKRHLFGYTSMMETFARPVGLERQITKAQELFATAYDVPEEAYTDPEAASNFIRHINQEIGKSFGENDFLKDRLNEEARKAAGVDLSRRRYNKLFRLLTRLEAKLAILTREWKKHEFTLIGKSGLAWQISREEFAKDADSACFIAYYTARRNLRSEFTIEGQQRAYDTIAEMLFQRCRASSTANWWAIAHVYPSPEVFAHLTEEQKGALLALWFTLLQEVALFLREIWNHSDINRETMVVRRGNDSSTWNQTAGAWNRARDHWIGLLYASGLDSLLDALCPGKALRLIAADVAAWHRSDGGGLDPNTSVWNRLPLPWEVMLGEEFCTRGQIEAACRAEEMDSEKTGWTVPRPHTAVAQYRPTPELVHGVDVGNAYLAKILRKAGWFSGKTAKSEPEPSAN